MTVSSRLPALLALAALLVGLAPAAQAQSRVATSVAPSLTLGTGAQGSALGHAYTALAQGPDALYWNPAGAARSADPTRRGGVFLSHSQWLVGIDYNAFGLVVPVTGSGVVGLSLSQLDYGRMERTTEDFQDGTGETFGASDVVLGLSYAQPLTDRFFIGGTAKVVRQGIYDMNASTVAFDVGFVLDSEYFNGMQLAASIMNFGGKMQMDGINAREACDIDEQNTGSNEAIPCRLTGDEWDLPLSFKFGVALPVVKSSYARLDLLSDAHQTNDNSLNVDVGGQAQFYVGALTLNLRAGYKDLALGDQIAAHETLGAGINTTLGGLRFGVDYAYVPFEFFDAVQMIDLRVHF